MDILPETFFEEILPEGVDLLTMTCYPLKANFHYPPDTDPWNGIYYETCGVLDVRMKQFRDSIEIKGRG